MGISKIVTAVVAAAIILGGALFLLRKGQKGPTLRVCTWSNYFPDSVLADFTAKTGIRVELNYISSNEELFAKLRAGATGFDVIQPSDYMVRQMRTLGMIRELDHKQLPHLSNLDSQFTQLPYDSGLKHSVPFSWGTTGLTVDTDVVPVKDGQVSWSLLFGSPAPRKTSMLDDMREAFTAYYLWKGLTPNSFDEKELATAATALGETKTNILMFSSEPRPLLLRGELAVAHTFSTDGYQARQQKPSLRYFIPKEGGTLWIDTFALPTTSENTTAAYRFIDYFLEEENALNTALLNQSATPNAKARAKLPAEMRDDKNFYPSSDVIRKLPMLEDPGKALETMNHLWTQLKS